MKKIAFHCEDCGKGVSEVLVDGYMFGDTLLEGVMFRVAKVGSKWKCLGVKDPDNYTDGLNLKKWMKECEKACEDDDFATCPECGGDIEINDLSDRPVRVLEGSFTFDKLEKDFKEGKLFKPLPPQYGEWDEGVERHLDEEFGRSVEDEPKDFLTDVLGLPEGCSPELGQILKDADIRKKGSGK